MTTRTTFLYLDAMPGIVFTGRTLANKSSCWRSATLTERKPLPTGVVMGPLSAILFFLIDSIVSSGNTDLYFFLADSPAGCSFQSMLIPDAFMQRTAESMTSGPMPSPFIRVMEWDIV